MKKTKLEKVNFDNILDIMYEPRKNRYSVLEYDGTRKEISEDDYNRILLSFRIKEVIERWV